MWSSSSLSRRHRAASRWRLEEERRVAYVALTRAKDALLVTADLRRQSRFLRGGLLSIRGLPEGCGKTWRASWKEGLLKRCRRLVAKEGLAFTGKGAGSGTGCRRTP